MADTFSDIWRTVRLYCPFVPIPLAQQWVRDRYRRTLDLGMWNAQVAESQFLIADAYATGTANVTYASDTVTLGGGGLVSATHVGRQFYTGGAAPYYTISAVDVGLNTYTLERSYGGTSNTTASFAVATVYLTPPTDCIGLMIVRDPLNNWKLRLRVSQDQLDRWDARRVAAGISWVVADYRQDANGTPRFELWPRRTTQGVYPFLYYKRPADLSADTDTPVLPIRGDVLKYGALADLALWPGTPAERNPMYLAEVHRMYETKWREEVARLMRVDQEAYPSDLWEMSDKWVGLVEAPIDAKFLQSHDV